jgi:hypothetical protein
MQAHTFASTITPQDAKRRPPDQGRGGGSFGGGQSPRTAVAVNPAGQERPWLANPRGRVYQVVLCSKRKAPFTMASAPTR